MTEPHVVSVFVSSRQRAYKDNCRQYSCVPCSPVFDVHLTDMFQVLHPSNEPSLVSYSESTPLSVKEVQEISHQSAVSC